MNFKIIKDKTPYILANLALFALLFGVAYLLSIMLGEKLTSGEWIIIILISSTFSLLYLKK